MRPRRKFSRARLAKNAQLLSSRRSPCIHLKQSIDLVSAQTPVRSVEIRATNLKKSPLLHLANNLARSAKTLHHLQTLLPSPNGVVALLEQIVEFLSAVHLLEEFSLHFFFGVPVQFVSIRQKHVIDVIELTRQAST
jgi:hypothetical protein